MQVVVYQVGSSPAIVISPSSPDMLGVCLDQVPQGAKSATMDAAALPNAPPETWFLSQNGSIIVDLSRDKSRWTQKVNDWRSAKETGGFQYNGKTYDSDERSCSRIIGAKLIADEIEKAIPGSFSIDWTAKDNTISTLNYSGVLGLFMALGQHIITTHATARTAKADILVASTVQQLDAIVSGLT
jgi:hypothetical protein